MVLVVLIVALLANSKISIIHVNRPVLINNTQIRILVLANSALLIAHHAQVHLQTNAFLAITGFLFLETNVWMFLAIPAVNLVLDQILTNVLFALR